MHRALKAYEGEIKNIQEIEAAELAEDLADIPRENIEPGKVLKIRRKVSHGHKGVGVIHGLALTPRANLA